MFVLKPFATPIIWILVLLVLGLVLTRRTRRSEAKPGVFWRVGRLLLLVGIVLLVAFSLNPVANFLTYPLESKYQPPPPEALRGLDVVVVLGGGSYPSGGLRQEAELGSYTFPRFYHGVRIFRESQATLLAFCGGAPRKGAESEAATMKVMALRLGIPEEKILAETTSRNTFENLANLAGMLPAGQGRRIGLVTSATHMWRACQVCAGRFSHNTIVPIPVHYTYNPAGWSRGSFVPSANNLAQSTVALHEWIGLIWYAVRHR